MQDEDINVNRAASTDLLTNKFVAPESHPTVTQALPNKLWEKLSSDIKQEAINQFKLVHLFKQINPNLHVCPSGISTGGLLEKGVQVPDRRLPFGRNRKPRPKRGGGYVGPGYRINNNLKNNPETNRKSSIADQSLLRADAPPHIPESVKKRAMSANTSTSNTLDSSEQSRSSDSHEQSDEQESTKKKAEDDEEENKINDSDENQDSVFATDQILKNEAGAKTNIKVVSILERRWGYFFCRTCLHAWVSGSVWCVKGLEKVYIQQTCNFCNKIVEPKVGGMFRESLFCEKWTNAVNITKPESPSPALQHP